jgi:hypothetical protein
MQGRGLVWILRSMSSLREVTKCGERDMGMATGIDIIIV